MKKAKVEITDIKRKAGVCIVAVKIKAGRYSFNKSFRIQIGEKDISVESFKLQLGKAIMKEVRQRKAIEPLKRLSKEPFELEYEGKNTKN